MHQWPKFSILCLYFTKYFFCKKLCKADNLTFSLMTNLEGNRYVQYFFFIAITCHLTCVLWKVTCNCCAIFYYLFILLRKNGSSKDMAFWRSRHFTLAASMYCLNLLFLMLASSRVFICHQWNTELLFDS